MIKKYILKTISLIVDLLRRNGEQDDYFMQILREIVQKCLQSVLNIVYKDYSLVLRRTILI